MSEASKTEITSPARLPFLWRWRAKAVDLLYPPTCNFCGEELPTSDGGPVLCRVCAERMKPPPGSYCRRCAMPCPELFVDRDYCPHCQRLKFGFSAVRTFGLYQRELREAVLRMKHAHEEPLAMSLGRELAALLKTSPLPTEIDLVAPVPMHWLKRIWHGTNAAETLATSLARELSLPLVADLMRCGRMLRKQGTLTARERRLNVRGAFAVSSALDIRGCTILLVDDVVTTGATADAIARPLRKAGAAEVFIVAAARGTGTP
jgi:ComF family protein